MPDSSDFALTRLQRPLPRATLIARAALESRLAEALARQRLVLLRAPAGFGKTTALVRALDRLAGHATVAWLAADADDDLPRFAAALVAALEPADLPWRQSPEGLLAALDGGVASRKALINALLNALLDADVQRGLLVIDDLHRIDDPATHEFIDALLQGLPPAWGLALSTRADPPLALARWSVQGEVVELGPQELRFSAAELKQLLGAQDAPADEASVAALLAATQGWPVALTLWLRSRRPVDAAAATEAPPAGLEAAARQQLFAYLGTEVMDTLPQPLAQFLMRASVLPVLTGPRCATVVGDPQAARWLELVDERGLFVSRLDSAGTTLVLDDLFRDFLDEQLQRRLPGELPVLLQRAADTEPDPVHRVAFLLRAQAHGAAAQALMDGATSLLARSGVGQVQRLLERFPSPLRESLPPWHFVRARLAWLRWDWATLKDAARRAGEGFAAQGWDDMVRSCAVLHAQAQAGLGALDAARDELQALRTQALPADDRAVVESTQAWVSAALESGDAAGEAIDRMLEALQDGAAPSLWYQCLPNFRFTSMPGACAAIDRWVLEALRVAGDEFVPLRLGAQLLMMWRKLWQGDLAGAQQLLDQIDDEARWYNMPRGLQWNADGARGFLLAFQGRAADARRIAQDLAAQFPSGHTWRRQSLSNCLRMHWLLGDEAAWRRGQAQFRDGAARGEWPYIAGVALLFQGQLALLDGDAAGAQAPLRSAIDALASIDTLGFQDSARVLLALALVRDARVPDAVQPLADALGTVPGRFAALLLGPDVLGDLGRVRWPASAPATLAATLAELTAESRRCREAPAPAALEGAAAGPPVDMPLTPRELSVLERVACGDSNKLIARALGLSPHTVKRHVANIFDKLDIANRAQAAVWWRTRDA